MDARIKALWLDALRGDEFDQGSGALCRLPKGKDGKKAACCLGVLSELAVREGVVDRTCHLDKEGVPICYYGKWPATTRTGEPLFLPQEVQDWAGLTEKNPLAGRHTLSKYNDGSEILRRRSFREIADLIERYL